MDEKFQALLSIAVIPQVVDIIVKERNLSELEAIKAFYHSKTYELLEKEETIVWHYSPLTIYHIWNTEQETGEIMWPEEGGMA